MNVQMLQTDRPTHKGIFDAQNEFREAFYFGAVHQST